MYYATREDIKSLDQLVELVGQALEEAHVVQGSEGQQRDIHQWAYDDRIGEIKMYADLLVAVKS